MKQEQTIREGGTTIINEDGVPKSKKPANQPKPEVTKEDDKDANES